MAENDSIESIRPPFSAYDFFGHLIPGLTFFVCLYIFELGIKEVHLSKGAFFLDCRLHLLLAKIQPTGDSAMRYAAFVGVAIMFVYAISHAISSISSYFIDRLLVYKGFGYPYRFLVLGETDSTISLSEDIKRHYYRGMFFWGNVCLLATHLFKVILDICLNRSWFWFVVGMWLVFFFVPIASRWLIGVVHHLRVRERGQLGLALGGQSSTRSQTSSWLGIETETPKAKERFRKLAHAFAVGFNGPWHTIQKVLRTDNPLERPLQEKYREAFQEQFKLSSANAESSNYWLSLFYVTSRSPSIYKMISNWFHQYSFARNMATAFYLAFVLCVLFVCFSFAPASNLAASERAWLIVLPLALFFMSVLMFLRFNYLYVAYYSRSLFRAFVFLQQVKEGSAIEKDKDVDRVRDS